MINSELSPSETKQQQLRARAPNIINVKNIPPALTMLSTLMCNALNIPTSSTGSKNNNFRVSSPAMLKRKSPFLPAIKADWEILSQISKTAIHLCFLYSNYYNTLMWCYNCNPNPAFPEHFGEHTLNTSHYEKAKTKKMIRNSDDSLTWVYTVETTFVDTLKIAFPPSTHFTSAPFCWQGYHQHQFILKYSIITCSILSLSFYLIPLTLVLLDSLIAKYPGGRLQETGMLNSWDDRRPSLRRGSQEYPTKVADTNTRQHKGQERWLKNRKRKITHCIRNSPNYTSRSAGNVPGVSRDSFLLAFVLALMSQVTW